jgi:hypothetical protein
MDFLNSLLGSPEEDELALDLVKKQQQRMARMEAPQIDPITLQKYEYEGDLRPIASVIAPEIGTPDEVRAMQAREALAGPSAMNQVATDPRLKQAQMNALASLQELSNGGMNAQDKAQLSQIQGQTAQADKGRRDAIMQNMAARGMSGSGNELLAQLQSSQAATDRQAQQGLDVAGMAQQRALASLQQAGSLGGNMQGQEFEQKSAQAQATDAISKFNAQNSQANSQFNATQSNNMGQFNSNNKVDTQRFNAGNTMQANMANTAAANNAQAQSWNARQGLGNSNVDLGNTETKTNAIDLPQQNFNNRAQLAGMQNQTDQMGVNYYGQLGDKKAKEKSEMIKGGVMMGAAMMSDERSKKSISNLSDQDIQDFLKAVKPKTFKYKNEEREGAAPGQRIGFILQDVAHTKVGKAIQGPETDDGLMTYDKDNLQGVLLAALSSLAKKEK